MSTDHIDPFAAELMTEYLAGRQEDIRVLESALTPSDANFHLIGLIGHNLHGSGGAYGFLELSDIGQALENAARNKDKDAAQQAVSSLRQFVTQTRG